jgi:hypothetical protein
MMGKDSSKLINSVFTVDNAQKMIPFLSSWAETTLSKFENNPYDDEGLLAMVQGDRFRALAHDMRRDANRIHQMDDYDLLRKANQYIQEISPYFNSIMAYQKNEYARNTKKEKAEPRNESSFKPSMAMTQ